MYPHPATIALFGLEKTLKYKKGSFEARQHELLQLMTLIEGLDKATPRLRVNHNVSWVELRKRVEAATRPVQLDRDEDPVDAVVCAYVALFWYHRPEDVTRVRRFRDRLHRHADAAARCGARRRRRRAAPQPDTEELRERVAHVAALLDEAQRGLTAIRRQLDG